MDEKGDLIKAIKETLQDIADKGEAECRFCGFKIRGNNYGEILKKLANHGEAEHEGKA